MLFLKRLNDTFEENAEKLIKDGKSEKEAYHNKNRRSFFVPHEARWSVLSAASENIGERIDHMCKIIERENPDLDGVLTNTKYFVKNEPECSIKFFDGEFTVELKSSIQATAKIKKLYEDWLIGQY